MKKNTVMFDLDGTLGAYMQNDFVEAYFSAICKRFCTIKLTPQELMKGIWQATGKMQLNDGSRINKDVFWDEFAKIFGEEIREKEKEFEDFYKKEFDEVKKVLLPGSNRRELIDELKSKNVSLILATNPIFPAVAVETRLKWIGLTSSDFAYTTNYANSRFCKPNPQYFTALLDIIDENAENCIMIGNNPVEDGCATEAGIETFIITDCIEGEFSETNKVLKSGSFSDACEFINKYIG